MKSRQNQLSREVYDTRDFIARSAAVIRVHGWSPNTPTKECVMADWPEPTAEDLDAADAAIQWGRALGRSANDFESRINAIAESTALPKKRFGYAAALVGMHQKHVAAAASPPVVTGKQTIQSRCPDDAVRADLKMAARVARKEGYFVRSSKDRRGRVSSYYVSSGGTTLRVSDHDIPATWTRTRGGTDWFNGSAHIYASDSPIRRPEWWRRAFLLAFDGRDVPGGTRRRQSTDWGNE